MSDAGPTGIGTDRVAGAGRPLLAYSGRKSTSPGIVGNLE